MTQFKRMDGITQLRLDAQSEGQRSMWSQRLWSCKTTVATEIDTWVERTGVHTRLVGWRASQSMVVTRMLSHSVMSDVINHSVVSDSLRPHGLQYTRLPCSSPTPRACSNSCPSSQWCQPTILSSVISFSFCFQSFPRLMSFPMNQFFVSGG